MSEERGVWGTFENGLNTGANQAEQMAAGVNSMDSYNTASMKVTTARINANNAQMAADVALNAKLVSQGYYGHGVKVDTPSKPAPWGLIVNLLVIAIIAWLCYITYDSGKYKYTGTAWVPLKSTSVPAKYVESSRKYSMERLTSLFVPGTPLAPIYRGCKTVNCDQPDIFAFDQYKKFAAHPETYETDICNYYMTLTNYQPEQLQPIWTIDRKASTCVVSNFKAVYADVQSRNKTYLVKIALVAAVMLSILIGLNVLFAKKKD